MKIVIAYHKIYAMLNSKYLLPMLVGANNAKEKEKQYFKDIAWDNFGDNISNVNNQYCELTSLYFLYKNFSKNEDYLGLMHYRRFFYNDLQYSNVGSIYANTNLYCQDIVNFLHSSNADVISTPKWPVRGENMQDEYKNFHNIEDFNIMLNVIQNKYPDVYEVANTSILNNKAYYLNMFIAKAPIFNQICSFLFDVLFSTQKQLSNPAPRVMGFLGERLLSIYIDYLIFKQHKVVSLNVLMIEEKQDNNVINIVSSAKNISLYYMVLSLLHQFSKTNENKKLYFYILDMGVSNRLKKLIKNLEKFYKFNIIYYDCVGMNNDTKEIIKTILPFIKQYLYIDSKMLVIKNIFKLKEPYNIKNYLVKQNIFSIGILKLKLLYKKVFK